MNAFLEFSGNDLWQVAGWTMVHFLWLGAVVGVAAAVLRMALRCAAPQIRYAAALVSLALVATLPVAVFGWLAANPQVSDRPWRAIDNAELPVAPTSIVDHRGAAKPPTNNDTLAPRVISDERLELPLARDASPADAPVRPSLAGFALEASVAYLPWVWLVGAPITFALLATGVVGAERLRRTSRPLVDGPITEACARLASAMRVGRSIGVAVCERIAAPVLVGIVRPVILLPPAALTGWSPDEIEMVLLHELAHVRRWDNLVNLLQRIVESLLFFHPAVWLLSHWVRREREACCDAVVVGRTNRPHAYAEMLVALAAQMPRSVLFHPAASCAMAAGPLRSRIRRILQLEDDPMLVSSKSFALVVGGLLIAATAAVLYLPSRGQAEESTTEATESTDADANDTISTERGAASGVIDLRETQIPLGKRLAVVLPHPISSSAVSDEVQKLNSEGHNVHVQPIEGGTLLLVYGAEKDREFPSLEEQGLADLAWKQIGLELQPIDKELLTRVQAEGYDGGVMVNYGRGRLNGAGEYGEIIGGDILVGLGVWPTRNMDDVGAVLDRGDLADLNPLRFYALRPIRGSNEDGQMETRMQKVTGRISVKSGSFVGMRRSSRAAPSGDGSAPYAATNPATAPTAPRSAIPSNVGPKPVLATPPQPPRSSVSGEELDVLREHIKFLEAQYEQLDKLYRAGRPGAPLEKVLSTAYELALARGDLSVAEGDRKQALDRYRIARARGEEALQAVTNAYEAGRITHDIVLEAAKNLADVKRKVVQMQKSNDGAASAAQPPVVARGPADDKSELRYEGRTFDEWRMHWLGSNKTLEALDALEAFGAAGYGQEAATVILNGTYSEGYIAKHTRQYLRRLPANDASPLVTHLVAELESDLSSNRRIAAIRALAAIGPNAESALDVLRKTLASEDSQERIAAAAAIKMIIGKDQYQKPVADVLGEELGITVVKTESGASGALPRDDAKDDGKAFREFNDAVIKEQGRLFPDGKF